MTDQRYVHDILQLHELPLMQPSHGKGVTRLSPHCYYPSLACSNLQICLQWSIFGTASCESHEFERTKGKVTVNMERNVSRHHTELVCLNARSYRIVHSR
ncbi:transposable element Tcb1 transposase [Trichonephila clavipes]|nr:transposable element Tcb1 transposase [Trichonephila clavipes]